MDSIRLEGVIQQSLDRTGDWTSLQPDKMLDSRPDALFDRSHDLAGDWVGGQLFLSFHSNDRYPVTGNTANEARVSVIGGQNDLLNKQTPGSIADRGYTIRDDELARALGTRADNNTLLRDLMAGVYIKIEEHAGDDLNPNPVIPWRPIVHVLDLIGSTGTFLPRDSVNSASFWAGPVVLAFEGKGAPRPQQQQPPLTPRDEERLDTHDPTPATIRSGLLGYTPVPAGVGNQPTCVTFVETIRDFAETNASSIRPTVTLAEMQQSNVAHEVLHALSLAHTGGIMCGTKKNYVKDPDRYSLTDKQLGALRGISEPAIGAGNDAVCGDPGAPPPPDCCPRRPPRP
jgi:hypothetical protein